jgi:hypothetical protein
MLDKIRVFIAKIKEHVHKPPNIQNKSIYLVLSLHLTELKGVFLYSAGIVSPIE